MTILSLNLTSVLLQFVCNEPITSDGTFASETLSTSGGGPRFLGQARSAPANPHQIRKTRPTLHLSNATLRPTFNSSTRRALPAQGQQRLRNLLTCRQSERPLVRDVARFRC